jgi:hypothetical protein
LLEQRDPEVPCLALHAFYLRIRDDFNVGVRGALDELGRKDAHGTVVGWKGLVQLGHLASDGGTFVHQVDLEASFGGIQGSLDPAHAGPNHHDGSYFLIAGLHDLCITRHDFHHRGAEDTEKKFSFAPVESTGANEKICRKKMQDEIPPE